MEGVESWWPPWPWHHDDVDEPETPLLLVPGIMGSILNVRDKEDSADGNRVWVCINHADDEYRKLWGRFNPSTQYVTTIKKDLEVYVPNDDYGLFAVSNLDPSIYVPLQVLRYYQAFISSFKAAGYESGKDLFGFGYDFRQSNRFNCQLLLERLEEVSRVNNGKRVNVVSHSMGGLVVKLLMATQPQKFERLVNKWIAIACPFGGAPPTMEALISGIQLAWGWQKYFFVGLNTFHQMMMQSPSVFELLPSELMDWTVEAPYVRVWLEGEKEGEAQEKMYSVNQLRELLVEAMRYNSIEVDGKIIPMPMSEDIWQYAAASRQLLWNAHLPATCSFYNLFGTGLQTPFQVTYGSQQKPLASIQIISDVLSDCSNVIGDSVVPEVSALADGLNAVERLGFSAEHRGLLESKPVYYQVSKWLKDGSRVDSWVLVERSICNSHCSCCARDMAATKQPQRSMWMALWNSAARAAPKSLQQSKAV